MVEYAFREGYRRPPGVKITAAEVGVVLAKLHDKNGGELRPGDLVLASQAKRHPLHGLFEWDDPTAAMEWRLEQARHLIRSVVVVYREDDEEERVVRAFVSIREDDAQFYDDVEAVMGDKDKRDFLLKEAWGRILAFRARYQELREFAALFATIDELEAALPPKVKTG
jgi:hypothetical protein|tara:strand:+ start:979 stop:1482 length:504 start_codon:yes stop_codon:yes gene_type:complete